MVRFSKLFSEKSGALRDFWLVYEAEQYAMRDAMMDVVRAHPVFRAMLEGIPTEQLDRENVASIERLRKAFVAGDWQPYADSLHAQGAMYARMNVPFSSWFDLTRVAYRVLVPAFIRAYEGDRLAAAMAVMHDFFDLAMAMIAERYIEVQHEERARMLVEAVKDYAIYSLDIDGVVTSWSPGAEALKGWKTHEIVGKSFAAFYAEQDRANKP